MTTFVKYSTSGTIFIQKALVGELNREMIFQCSIMKIFKEIPQTYKI